MIYFYAISTKIDHLLEIVLEKTDHLFEIISKQPFWSFLWKEYKISASIVFQFNLLALIWICLWIPYNRDYDVAFPLSSLNIPKKIIIALRILLLPCIAFYLIQIPFKLKHFWLYFFLVFFVFFLAHYFLPRITSVFYPFLFTHNITYYFPFGCFQYDKKTTNMCIFPILAGIFFFFKFPYNHWVSFAFGILIFNIIIYWLWRFYDKCIVPFTSIYNFSDPDFYKLSFNNHPHWVVRLKQ